ncbi:unnamed protein product [Schistosoma mattheei]|uniref:Uncharacterized protein n=1 Tax=Schistosoma mattheei TaxID=31246 RepID=A0AA85BVB3_9TREM|nr:unnamed protein product [Schistosoma mattheei]
MKVSEKSHRSSLFGGRCIAADSTPILLNVAFYEDRDLTIRGAVILVVGSVWISTYNSSIKLCSDVNG